MNKLPPVPPVLPESMSLVESPPANIDALVAPLMAARAESPIVVPTRAADLAARIPRDLPADGAPLDELLAGLEDLLLAHSRRNTHPGFFGYIASGGLPIDALANAMVGALNQNVVGYPSSPAAATIERAVLRWLANLVGYDEGADGVFLGGGSSANLTAMAAAASHQFGPDYRARGIVSAAGGKRPVVLCSKATHFSVQRAAALLGIGSDQVVAVETDAQFRLRPDALESALEREECVVCVVGSAGTTNTGAIDPLKEMAAICARHDTWFHIDAAYGGGALLSPELAPLFDGIAAADSVTMDLHKWFYNPIDSSVVLFRDPKYARSVFYETSDYVAFPPDGPPEQHMFFHLGPDLSRRFRALPAYIAFAHYGRDRLGRNVLHNVECARYLADLARYHDDLELVTAPELSIVTFRYRPKRGDVSMTDARVDDINREIRARVESEADYLLSPTTVNGRPVLRACIINHATRASHIEGLVSRVREIGVELSG